MKFFVKELIKNPEEVGTICESSSGLARLITSQVGLGSIRQVVELGPGTGIFTREIRDKVSKDCTFIALESNYEFAEQLKEEFPRVNIINACASKLTSYVGAGEVDVVICGLPWTFFSKEKQQAILKGVLKVLKKGGEFLTVACIHSIPLPSGQRFKNMLEDNFTSVSKTDILWKNIPPALVYVCEK